MDAKEIIKRSTRGFFIIYASINIFFTVYSWFLSESRTEGIFYRDTIMLLAIAILTSQLLWMLYSKKELTHRQFMMRHIAHFFAVQGTSLIGIIIITCGLGFELGPPPLSVIILTMLSASLTYVIVVLVDSYDTRKLASDMNKKLKERYGHQ